MKRMEAVLQGLAGIFEVALIAGLGFFLSRKGWFWETAGKDLTRLTMTVGIPAMMIYSMESRFTRDSLLAMAPDLLLPFASIFAAYLLGRVWAAILRIPKGRRGIFVCTCCIANAIFIGLPVNLALFGEEAVPSAMLYYIANTAMFWGLGAYLIIQDAGAGQHLSVLDILKKLRTPPLMGFLAGVALVLLDIRLPDFLLTSVQYVGNTATPLALLVIGMQMSRIPFSSIHLDRDLVGAMIGRFILSPFCIFLLLPFIPVSPISAQVFFTQAGMPAMTNMTILAASVGADAKYATTINCVSLLLGLFFIPFYMFLLA